MTILEKIIAYKRREVDALLKQTKISDLEKKKLFSRKTLPLSGFISDPSRTGIIAEFKRKSPSKGIINCEAEIREVTMGYSGAGASGLSVLTDNKFFDGSLEDLILTHQINSIPVLRKDFIIHELQVIESRAAGADAILLIAAALSSDQVFSLAKTAHSLNLEVLLEVHSEEELEMANDYVNIIGVNNRDLNTFRVDVEVSAGLADKIPEQFLKISESGISSPSIVKYLREVGYDGFLIGELFMKSKDPVISFSEFVKEIR